MRKSSKVESYQDKQVFVGIDVHKRTYTIVSFMDGIVIKKWTTPASNGKLVAQLKSWYPQADIHAAYEAGFSGFGLHRALTQAGIENLVVNPGSIETTVHNRVKTDKRDAKKIASLLAAGRLSGIRVPTEQTEHKRLLTRTREQLVKERTSIKNMIRMRAHQFGLLLPDDKREMSQSLLKSILAKTPSPEFTIILQAYRKIWKVLDTEIKAIEAKLKQQAQQDPLEVTYRSAPGIGPLSSRILSNELGDMSQFANERQLFSYTGLTPSEHSSGDAIRRGHITRQGNTRVRHILCESAWVAIRKDRNLRDFYQRLYPRTGKKKAIVAVARKLVGRLRSAFRQGEPYRFNPIG
ncbi:IS110 family transposase [Synechococcus sp. PCC 7335]|uniref:IS110 family transposase n=1 Tax=Synechococcus sp. (strain ATCC 29403 / PCC 7335) TaxID=91464 RepID=UPI00056EBB9E|nr:IS110 family transposase [Synechococcus sp. PCC 7335]